MSKKKTGSVIAKAAVIIGVLVIPLMYSYFYLGAFWDPYARLDDVPVAVVNLDKGAVINGKDRNLGNEICENLEKDGTLKFDFTDEKTADNGVLNQDYYAEIIIPSDFSDNVSTVGKDTEKIHSSITYKANTKTLLGGLNQLKDGFGNESNSKTLLGGSYQLSLGLNRLKENNEVLNNGMNSLTNGLKTLNNSSIALTSGAGELAAGTKKLSSGTAVLNSNAPALSNGVSALADGAGQLLSGADNLKNGATKVSDGAVELYNGVLTLKSGTSALNDGANKLNDGINTAKNGVDDSVKNTNEELKALSGLPEYAGEPVNTVTEYVQPVENYGSAFAPYFMGLSLWVGGLMIFFGIYLDYNKKIKILTKDTDNRFVRGLAFAGISTAQGIMLAIVIKYALGITVNNMGLLYSSCILTSLTFMLIIQFFIMYLGNAGKFVSLLLLILQLTSSAGTFPIETQSEFFVVINKLLPMTYSTQLFKEAISGTSGEWAGKNAMVLIGYMLAFIALTCAALVIENIKNKKSEKLINQ